MQSCTALSKLAKANKVNPQEWLAHALQEMSLRPVGSDVDDLLPLSGYKAISNGSGLVGTFASALTSLQF